MDVFVTPLKGQGHLRVNLMLLVCFFSTDCSINNAVVVRCIIRNYFPSQAVV